MIKVGLTGGIGSGKSMVAAILEHLLVPVYHADKEARKFLEQEAIIEELRVNLGSEIMDETGSVNRSALATLVFNDESALKLLNSIIHPLVKEDFDSWLKQQESAYVVQEAAILFESGFNRFFDRTVVVDAPLELCISRVMKRDNITEEQVLMRMKNQWDQRRKLSMADHVLLNDGDTMLLPQVLKLHNELLGISQPE